MIHQTPYSSDDNVHSISPGCFNVESANFVTMHGCPLSAKSTTTLSHAASRRWHETGYRRTHSAARSSGASSRCRQSKDRVFHGAIVCLRRNSSAGTSYVWLLDIASRVRRDSRSPWRKWHPSEMPIPASKVAPDADRAAYQFPWRRRAPKGDRKSVV